MSFKKWLNIALLTAVMMGFVGCSDDPKDGDKSVLTKVASTDMPVVALKSVGATTVTIEAAIDYSAGGYGVISSDNYSYKATISTDAAVGFADENFYILERFPENLDFLTPSGDVINQIPFENSMFFNAYGVCGNGNGKIYVGSYEDVKIAVFEKENGGIKYANDLNLPSFANAKLSDLKFANGKIYAALQFLENWAPSGKSKILEIDETGNVLREFESDFMNVLQIEIRGNNLFVVDAGNYFGGEFNGGITKIDLTNGTKTTVFTASSTKGNPYKAEFATDNSGYLKLYKAWGDEYVVQFSLSGSAINLTEGDFSEKNPVSDISYNQSTKTLWLASGNEVFKF